jgi:formate dehydrogenase maturation protein FdhE
MNQKQLARKLLEFNKTILDKSFDSLMMVQDQNKRLITRSLEKLPIPDEGKKAISHWTELFKKGSEKSKAMMDEGYKNIVQYLDKAEKKQNTMSM